MNRAKLKSSTKITHEQNDNPKTPNDETNQTPFRENLQHPTPKTQSNNSIKSKRQQHKLPPRHAKLAKYASDNSTSCRKLLLPTTKVNVRQYNIRESRRPNLHVF